MRIFDWPLKRTAFLFLEFAAIPDVPAEQATLFLSENESLYRTQQ